MPEKLKSLLGLSFWDKKTVFLSGLCFLVFIFSLVLTLDLEISLAIFILAFSLVIFVSSFSRGWLFLLVSALLLSSLRIGRGDILFFDLSLLALILLGLFKIFLERGRLPRGNYDAYFFSVIALAFIGGIISWQNNGLAHPEAVRLGINFFFYWFLFLVFQYFFQTEKRIRRFFWALIFSSLIQSFRGLFLFLSAWPSGRESLVFEFGLLTPFMIVGIFSSWGMWTSLKEKLKKAQNENEKDFPIGKNDWFYVRLAKWAFFFQLAVFALVSSPTESVFLGLGFLFLGILARDKKMVLASAFLTLIFSFASFYWVGGENFSQSGMKFIRDFKTASSSVIPFGQRAWPADFFQQKNSYFYFWGNLGILGILALTGLLFAFFSDVYEKYKRSDGEKRTWLMAVFGILVAFLTLAFREKVFLVGPSAVIFWLLAGVAQNLGTRQVFFGLTETRLEGDGFSKRVTALVQKKPEGLLEKNYLDSCQPRFDFYKHQ